MQTTMNVQTQRAADLVTVTAVCDDGAKWGYPGRSVFRYEGSSGWAWIPRSRIVERVGDVIDMNAATLDACIVSRAALAVSP
jgi:hypothetical protein